MTAKMRFSLKAGERIFINGAVLTVSQKVTLTLLNDARFLLESHVMQLADATTPMRQLYFVVQSLLINPQEHERGMAAFRKVYDPLLIISSDEGARIQLKNVGDLVARGRTFEALKAIRTLFEPKEVPASAENSRVPEKAA